jgi:hypothetical protein
VIQKNGLPIHTIKVPEPKLNIYVDASATGWGVTSPLITASGFWRLEEQENFSINVRELKTILFALKLHAKKCEDSTIKIYSDNITALKYTTKAGGTSSVILQDLAIQIQQICNKHRLQVIYQHVPGILNTEADRLSRLKKPLYESSIPRRMFNKIQQTWGRLKIDAFAARHNHQLPNYWSLTPDPSAKAIDAFQQAWLKKGMFLYPPWKLIPKVLKMIQTQKLKEANLVTPLWPSQYWYPMILRMKHLDQPIIQKIGRKWYLAAWRLSTTSGVRLV